MHRRGFGKQTRSPRSPRIRSVERVLQVFDYLGASNTEIGVIEVAEAHV